MLLISWNVNSLRSAESHFLEFMHNANPDILMIQELRATQSQLSFFLQFIEGYNVIFNPSGRPGYAGTALYYKKNLKPDQLSTGDVESVLSIEGRQILFRKKDTFIFNFYIPNGGRGPDRLAFKMEYCGKVLEIVSDLLKSGKNVIIGGDLNVAHTEIDLFNPKANQLISGFLSQERKWLDDLLGIGMVDSFRLFNKQQGNYTWWSLGDPTRSKNKGWRFDYFLVSESLVSYIKKANILKDVFGSDHCPISLNIDLTDFT